MVRGGGARKARTRTERPEPHRKRYGRRPKRRTRHELQLGPFVAYSCVIEEDFEDLSVIRIEEDRQIRWARWFATAVLGSVLLVARKWFTSWLG
jgi:hypothetical protein